MMDDTAPATIGETIARDYLPLSRAAMIEVGAAAQTLAALYLLSRDGQTFAGVPTIAERAGLDLRTSKRHMAKLVLKGWLLSHGRERRRTVTYGLTPKALDARRPYHPLPRWARTLPSWGERAVVACLASAAQHVIDGRADDDRACLTPATIGRQTGLTAPTVRAARNKLGQAGLIDCHRAARIALKLDAPAPPYWTIGELPSAKTDTTSKKKMSPHRAKTVSPPRKKCPSTAQKLSRAVSYTSKQRSLPTLPTNTLTRVSEREKTNGIEVTATYRVAPRPILSGAALDARKATLRSQLAAAAHQNGGPA